MPVAYILREKFHPSNVKRSSKIHFSEENHMRELSQIVEQIQEAFQSITWLTYRCNLEMPLYKSNKTSDAGWGCMLRTGQMLLCQAIRRHVLGEKFMYRFHGNSDQRLIRKYNKILSLFMDNINDDKLSPFGIQSIAKVGMKYRKEPGDWYGPQAISCVLKQLNKECKPFPDFSMVVCTDGNIFFDKI